jgi:DNA-binding MarR family transcriptional regulator
MMSEKAQPESIDIQIVEQLFTTTALHRKSGDNFIFKKFGLTTSLYAILTKIAAGINSSSDLQIYIEGTPASITQKLNQLEKKGIITRHLDEQDKRRWNFKITPQGEQILESIYPVYEGQLQLLFQDYDRVAMTDFLEMLKQLEVRLREVL